MAFDPELAAAWDKKLREKVEQFKERKRRKAMQREAFKLAREFGKANRHSERLYRRELEP